MDITSKSDRIRIVDQIESAENKQRKAISLKQSEIFNDRLFQYVQEELLRHFSPETVNEMPICSFINFPRRIVKNTASIYKHEPKRIFNNTSEDQASKLEMVYEDAEADWKFKKANENYVLQDQSHMMIVPVQGKIIFRTLLAHQIDAIPNRSNPPHCSERIL